MSKALLVAAMVSGPLLLVVGVLVVGLMWLALGYALWRRSGVPTEQPSRVRSVIEGR
jgi:hypothetical protein